MADARREALRSELKKIDDELQRKIAAPRANARRAVENLADSARYTLTEIHDELQAVPILWILAGQQTKQRLEQENATKENMEGIRKQLEDARASRK